MLTGYFAFIIGGAAILTGGVLMAVGQPDYATELIALGSGILTGRAITAKKE